MFKKLALFAPLCMLTVGCAHRTVYHNPNLTSDAATQRQFAIDDGYCVGTSMGSVPMPMVRVYSSGQESYSVAGTITSNTGAMYRYSGTGYSTPSFATGFATGVANGASIGLAIAARNAQRRVYHGCMTALGWLLDTTANASAPATGTYSYPCAIKSGPGCTN